MTPADSQAPWFKRHPLLALLGVNAAVFLLLAGVAEIALRITVSFNPGYYVAVEGSSRELVYPFGTITINSHGFPDEEFDLGNPLRVGYFGDSVTYGTGAGYGYRISEHLEQAYPAYEHMNFGGIDLSLEPTILQGFIDIARRFELTRAIYILNLNDILPEQVVQGEAKTTVFSVRLWLQAHLDWLRGRSYLYTYVRTLVKSYLARGGTGWLGYPAYELFPVRNEAVVVETAQRVNRFRRLLAEEGIELIVVILPYEMQISEEAAATYANLGVQWGEGFLEGTAQRILLENLDPQTPRFDAYYSFVDPGAVEASRRANRLGAHFVYDRGDKLDWNHPNREGHRLIAEYLIRQDILGEREGQAKGPDRPVRSPEG